MEPIRVLISHLPFTKVKIFDEAQLESTPLMMIKLCSVLDKS